MAETETRDCQQEFRISQSPGQRGPTLWSGGEGVVTYHPFSYTPVRLVLGIKVLYRGIPLVVPLLMLPVGHRSLETFDLGLKRGVPSFLPLRPHSVLQTYLILFNTV